MFSRIVILAWDEKKARLIAECMDTDKLEEKSDLVGVDEGDYTFGDAIAIKKEKRRAARHRVR